MGVIISDFRKEHGFLNTFFDRDGLVEYDGLVYRSVEAAFQAAKLVGPTEEETRKLREPFQTITPREAKLAGSKIQRSDWDKIKLQVMYDITYSKFLRNRDLRRRLIRTGGFQLINGNTKHDNFYGECMCNKCKNKAKANHLGKILMQVRDRLIFEEDTGVI